MSFSELLPTGPGTPPGLLPLRELILTALAETASIRREVVDFCTDCRKAADGLCADHRDDSALADDYEAAYGQIKSAAYDWDALVLVLGGTGRPL